MYKAVFCDLDGTLFDRDGHISDFTLNNIRKAADMGVHFVPCTGRVPYTAYDRLECLFDLIKKEIVGVNGSVIIEGDDFVKAEIYSYDQRKFLIEYGIDHHLFMHIQTKDHLYFLNHDLLPDQISNYYGTDIDEERARELINEDLYKLAYLDRDFDKLCDIYDDIMAIRQDMELFKGNLFLEMCTKGQDKAQGVRDFCKLHDIDIKDTIGIGDSFNDLPMLQACALSCAPANARAEIKEKVDYLSPYSNNESAVGHIISKFILGDE